MTSAAGLTVTAYLVPQVMAYSTLAGLPAVTGLWAAIVALTVYVFFGHPGSYRSDRNRRRH